MKYLIIFLLMLPSVVKAQLIIENTASKNKDSLILYVNVDNKITLYYKGSATDTTLHKKIAILSGDYEVSEQQLNGNATQADIKLSKPGPISLRLRIGGKDSTINAYGRYVPDPYIALNRGRNTEMTKQELLGYKGLLIHFADKSYVGNFMVTSYVMSTVIDDQITELKAEGPYFSKDVTAELEKVKPGSKVFFEDIHARCPDGQIRFLNSIAIKIL